MSTLTVQCQTSIKGLGEVYFSMNLVECLQMGERFIRAYGVCTIKNYRI